jgi:hypothetical protein
MSAKRPIPINEKAPFQKWAESDFAYKTTVEHPMHWQARLFYRGLLQIAFRCATRPNLPDDDEQLKSLLGGIPDDIWKAHRAAVRAWFKPDKVNGVKVLTHHRLQEDWQELQDFREEQRTKANKSWESRRKKAIARPEPSHGNATAMPRQCQYENEIETEGEIETDIKNEHERDFQPTNPTDGRAAGRDVSSNSNAKPSAKENFLERMQDSWATWRARFIEEEGLGEDDDIEDFPPIVFPKNGQEKMFGAFREHDLTLLENKTVTLLLSAWGKWLVDRYERPFHEYSIEKIKAPLSIFADDFPHYLAAQAAAND